jgi:hypothetical protein
MVGTWLSVDATNVYVEQAQPQVHQARWLRFGPHSHALHHSITAILFGRVIRDTVAGWFQSTSAPPATKQKKQ